MNKVSLNSILKYGIIGLMIYVIVHIVAWKVDLSLFLNPLVVYLLPIVLIVLGILAQLEVRKKLGGYIDFSKALVVFILTIIIAVAGATILDYFIFNVIDPAAKATLGELAIQEAIEMVEKMGKMMGMENEMSQAMDEDMLREVMAQQDASGKGGANLIFSFFTQTVLLTIAGLIAAAVVKRNPPIQFD